MAYSRPPVQAGRALKRTPENPGETSAGVFDYSLDVDIATPTSLGVVQVGNGLSITPLGVLSATGSGSSLLNVKTISYDYTATDSDEYIGCLKKNIVVTLPLGVVGKLYIIKNQTEDGNIKVTGTAGQLLDTSTFKTLGNLGMLLAVFVGPNWSLI